jgi:hypothetical protein
MAVRFRLPHSIVALALCSVACRMCVAQDMPVSVKQESPGLISVAINGQPFTELHMGREDPKPYLAPLRTASGKIVTRHYPMEEVAGESHDHQHHRGLWIGYGEISGINFWENERSYKTTNRGTIVLDRLGKLQSGKDSGSIAARFRWLSPDGKLMLLEDRQTTFSGNSVERMITIDLTLTAKADVQFADTKEGFFALRLADSMNEQHGGLMTNSEGAKGEKNVWGKRANWVDYVGTVEGQKVSILMQVDPQSYNSPTRWHSRAYGLFAANPFGLKDFEPKSTEKGGKSLRKGEKLHFIYRVVIRDGEFSETELHLQWAALALRPESKPKRRLF